MIKVLELFSGTDENQSHVVGGGTNRLERYRIPPNLIYSLFLD